MRSRGYWTKARCQSEAARYSTRSAFARGTAGAYQSAQSNGWLDDICPAGVIKKNGYWSKTRCAQQASKFMFRSEFKAGSPKAYDRAGKSGWLNEICAHMNYKKLPDGYWTHARCQDVALKYSSRLGLSRAHGGAVNAIEKAGWGNEVYAHMEFNKCGFNPTLPAILYYYEIGGLYKLGITNRTLRQRVGSQFKDIRVLARKRFKVGADAAAAERAITNFVDDCHRYDGPPVLALSGNTELFTADILGLDLAA